MSRGAEPWTSALKDRLGLAKGQNSGKWVLVSQIRKKYRIDNSCPGPKPIPELSIFAESVAAGMAMKWSDNREVLTKSERVSTHAF